MASLTRVGIVGVGGIGAAYASAIAASQQLALTAVCDEVVGRAEAVAPAGTRVFGSSEELAASDSCDMVLVATPPSTHAHVTSSMLGCGLDVLCEKPFSIDLPTAVSMLAAGAENHRIVTMASKFRYVADITLARRLILDGRIGQPITAEVTFASHVDMANRWNSDPAIAGGGVLIDNGTHAVDIVRYMLGPILRVSAMRGVSDTSASVEDTGVILAETADHTIATVTVSWSIAPQNPFYATIHGTRGSIDLGWQESRVRGHDGDWEPFGNGYHKLDALRANVEDFAVARSGGDPMRISESDVIASVSVVAAVYEAIDTGAWVEVDQAAWLPGAQAVGSRTIELAARAG